MAFVFWVRCVVARGIGARLSAGLGVCLPLRMDFWGNGKVLVFGAGAVIRRCSMTKVEALGRD